ncbi:MAG: trimethylamine methyltransferase family protein [Deltaproteobacteria bacterium]|jgi:trimethylamine--corrinoid protein Co-methyltransferase|nr:trimethylamine methyltransferase family protein [Deltaproteobacteria bacterium]
MRKGTVAATEMATGWGLRTFTRDALDKIHAATLDVLRSTGVSIDCDEALDILNKGGCWTNKKTRVVRFPDHIVTQALSLCPSHILLAGRNPDNDFMMGGKQVGFTTFGVGVLTEDLETGEIRESTKEDVEKIARLTDALTHMDILTAPVAARDKPDSSYDLHMLEAALTYCSKHYASDSEDGERTKKLIEMAAAVAGGTDALKQRPIVSFGICPTSPLQIIKSSAEVVIQAAKHWLPINVLSMVLAGASSPISISGALVTHNAEVLAGIILAQLTNPGTPVIYGSSSTTLDMTHGTAVVGVPEMAMISAAAADLANYYGLPSYVAGG